MSIFFNLGIIYFQNQNKNIQMFVQMIFAHTDGVI